MFFFIPDLFTPYIEGRERAINRNWQDMSNYNNMQQGQLNNLFNLATFSPRVNREYEQTQKAALESRQNERVDALNELIMPYLRNQALYQNYWGMQAAPQLGYYRAMNPFWQYQQNQLMWDLMQQRAQNPMGVGPNAPQISSASGDPNVGGVPGMGTKADMLGKTPQTPSATQPATPNATQTPSAATPRTSPRPSVMQPDNLLPPSVDLLQAGD